MPSSESLFTPVHREQFYAADLHGKLTFFETRLAAHRLDAPAATEMLAAIHSELETPQRQDHTVYARYASLMETFRQAAPDIYQAVVGAWKSQQEAKVAPEMVRSTAAIPESALKDVNADEGFKKNRDIKRIRTALTGVAHPGGINPSAAFQWLIMFINCLRRKRA